MTRILIILVGLLVALCGFGRAQQQHAPKAAAAAAAAAPAVSPGVTVVETTVYPLPLEQRDKVRDLQHENDSIEIENQKMLVKIEQNKARQALIVDRETMIFSEFGRTKQLDLALYEADPAQIALRKKTK